MHIPQVIALSYLSTDTIDLLRKEVVCKFRPPANPAMFDHIRADLAIIRERDPAARGWLEIVCCYPGFQRSVCTGLAIDSGPAICL